MNTNRTQRSEESVSFGVQKVAQQRPGYARSTPASRCRVMSRKSTRKTASLSTGYSILGDAGWNFMLFAFAPPTLLHDWPKVAHPSASAWMTCRLFCVLRGAIGLLQLLHVRRRQLRPIERDRHLVDLPGECERHLIVAVIHRRRAAVAD